MIALILLALAVILVIIVGNANPGRWAAFVLAVAAILSALTGWPR